MNHGNMRVPIQSASILDKTDWRRTIHNTLELCVKYEGRYPDYLFQVRKLVSVVACPYPGFDAKKMIIKEVKRQETKYTDDWNIWHAEHETDRRRTKQNKRQEIEIALHYDVYIYIRDLLAKRRILLYGIRQTYGGDQAPDPEE